MKGDFWYFSVTQKIMGYGYRVMCYIISQVSTTSQLRCYGYIYLMILIDTVRHDIKSSIISWSARVISSGGKNR